MEDALDNYVIRGKTQTFAFCYCVVWHLVLEDIGKALYEGISESVAYCAYMEVRKM